MTERILNAFLVRHLIMAIIFLIAVIIAAPVICMMKLIVGTQDMSTKGQLLINIVDLEGVD